MVDQMAPRSIAGVNNLPAAERDAYYTAIIPPELLDRFGIDPEAFTDAQGNRLVQITALPDTGSAELDLRPCVGAPDPLLYAHVADTPNNQIEVLLIVVNDPASPRFDTDRMPDGTPTNFGTTSRNIPEEIRAMAAGLAPGQVRRGLRLSRSLVVQFEAFVASLGHELLVMQPLAYHNAIRFERMGFGYISGKAYMEQIDEGFQPGGELFTRLDGSTPFRQPGAEVTVRGRSWAIHDGILGQPFEGVRMYKRVGYDAGTSTFVGGVW
jgi:hypothetical protein